MKIGDLRERIEIRRKELAPDGMGGHTETETVVGVLWAKVTVPRSRDGIVAMRDAEIRTHEITVRSYADVRMNDIAVWKGERLLVRSLRPERECIVFDCVPEDR
jgi:head-tail adaptor